MAALNLTCAELRKRVSYDPETGVLTSLRSSRVLGAYHSKGYVSVTVAGYQYLAHRLAWLYMTGGWPQDQIDHIDGDRANNRWANLRCVTCSQNNQNQRRGHRDGSSGILGVSFSKASKTNPWVAQIVAPIKRRIWLGSFPTKEAAQEAYLKAKRQIHECGTL